MTTETPDTAPAPAVDVPPAVEPDPRALSDEEWRRRLSPAAYEVLRRAGTERAFTGEYVDTEDPGTYRCAACGQDLFDAASKFHSGSGWPSFTTALDPAHVTLHEDRAFGMVRIEARCSRCDSHLGHVFDDGPASEGGQRWCMNSVALDFQPTED